MLEQTYLQTTMQDNKSQHFILDHLIKSQMSFCHAALSVFVRPQFAKIALARRVLSIFHLNVIVYSTMFNIQ